MKTLLLTLAFLSPNAYALDFKSVPNIELCALEAENSAAIQEISSINVEEASELSAFHLNLVNQHLKERGYSEEALTFAQVKELFANGKFSYDDLYVNTFRATATGKVYIHVFSYPGDNQYGLIFDDAGRLVATNGDSSITVLNGSSSVACFDLQ